MRDAIGLGLEKFGSRSFVFFAFLLEFLGEFGDEEGGREGGGEEKVMKLRTMEGSRGMAEDLC